jgi:hypothetical protein
MQVDHQSKIWRIFQVASGNFLESYDVAIFAYGKTRTLTPEISPCLNPPAHIL